VVPAFYLLLGSERVEQEETDLEAIEEVV